MSGFLSTWVSLLSNWLGLHLNGWAYFWERGNILENTPTPPLEQPLKFIAHGCTFESLRYYKNCVYTFGVLLLLINTAFLTTK